MRFQTNSGFLLRFAEAQALASVSPSRRYRIFIRSILLLLIAFLTIFLSACSSTIGQDETSGPEFAVPSIALSLSNINGLDNTGYAIDTSNTSQGYVSAAGISVARLKFQVSCGDMSYHYDLPNDGTPISYPLNMGNGAYTFTIWQNTSGNRYVELSNPSISEIVSMESEFVPFIRPNYFCNYNETSECVAKAHELTAGAKNQGEALKNIYEWVVANVEYDTQKASLVGEGYVPNPDETLRSRKGICFDYASLAAAMLRSQGIPCKILTGYVSPDNIYHAWNMVYINGSWQAVGFSVNADTWTRIDTTFAAGGASINTGDGSSYTDRYTY